jgi:hypothetical protein
MNRDPVNRLTEWLWGNPPLFYGYIMESFVLFSIALDQG